MTILPIYNIIALPGAKLWLQTNLYRELSDKTPVVGERVTLLAPKEEKPRAQLTADSFQPIGNCKACWTISGSDSRNTAFATAAPKVWKA